MKIVISVKGYFGAIKADIFEIHAHETNKRVISKPFCFLKNVNINNIKREKTWTKIIIFWLKYPHPLFFNPA